MSKYQIKPTADFTERTIAHLTALSRRRKFVADIAMPLLLFSPFLARELWLLLWRGRDYFAIGHLPLAHTIIAVYGLFLSGLAAYALVSVCAFAVVYYFFGFKRLTLAVRTVGGIFRGSRLGI